ncbi:hypothetical protein GIY56_13195 [Paracoccus sp. YIM 132242]|uniref:Uncharacterized protein n=1 Tax=Paracoccus lichenicola TaxID=2665644 RepID=A0A6L6HS37_9RHOB|nr:hypothetical protein [Paracoccus lichenicola]MTE01239.1 hypothetical protein [Paracoccus lichenicola]
MAQTLDQTAGTGRPPSIVAVFADRNAAAAATQGLRNAGIDGASIHDASGSGSLTHPALARLSDADRQAVAAAVAENGAVLVVTSRSQAEHDLALSVLNRQPGGHAPTGSAPAGGSAGGDETALPDGIRGTTRDTPYTIPKDEHAGHGDAFPDHMPDSSPGGARTGLYIVHGD